MTLEEILEQDRVKFKSCLESANEYRQATMLVTFLRCIFSARDFNRPLSETTIARVNAFMDLLLSHAVPHAALIHIIQTIGHMPHHFSKRKDLIALLNPGLESTVGSKAFNRKDLMTNTTPFKGCPVNKDTAESGPVPDALPDAVLLEKLASLCCEYKSWFERMRVDSKTADPKNHPNRRQLKERDDICLQINALATPDVILKLVNFAIINGE